MQPFALRRLTEPVFNATPPFNEGVPAGASALPQGVNGDVLAARYDSSGRVVRQFVPPLSNSAGVVQAVPVSLLQPARDGQTSWSEDTIAGIRYRVVAEPIADSSDVAVMLAPLGDVDATVDRLHWLEVGVGISLLVAATGVGLWLVRIGLKPLSDMAATADAIAGGELDRRVQVARRRGGRASGERLEQRLRRRARRRRTSSAAS